MQNARTRSLIHLHFIIFIWGFTSILGALIDLDSSAIVWFRMMIGAGSIALYFMLFSPKSFVLHLGAMKYYLLGGVLISVHWLLFFYAIKISFDLPHALHLVFGFLDDFCLGALGF